MNIKRTLKIVFFVLLFLAVVAYLIYALFGMESTNPEEECVEVSVVIEDGQDAFVDSLKVLQILKESNIQPIGKKMKEINTRQIETTLEQNPFVISVECYSTNNGMDPGKARLCVRVNQRIPVMIVFDDKSSYYVDSHANVINTDSVYAKNVLVANGNISQNYLTELVQLAQFIKTDDFWDNQIEQIYVTMNRMKEREVTLIPRVGSQKIFLGVIDGYDKKLRRLRKFYEKGMNKVGWNKYSILNLEYDNQVVGVIKGKEIVVADMANEPEKHQKTTPDDTTTVKADSAKTEAPKADTPKDDKPKPKVENNKAEKTEPAKTEKPEAKPADNAQNKKDNTEKKEN